VVEVFFQWVAISSIADAGSSLGTVGTLGLMVSHFLMAPEVPYGIIMGVLATRAVNKHDKAKRLVDMTTDEKKKGTIIEVAEVGTTFATGLLKAVAPKIVIDSFDGMAYSAEVRV